MKVCILRKSNKSSRPPFPLQGAFMSRLRRMVSVLSIAATCAAWAATQAQAVIVVSPIDGFGDSQYEFASGANGSSNSGTVGVTAGLVSPSGRSVYVEKTAGSTNVNLKIEALDDDGDATFSVSRASNIAGNVLLQWDGDTTDLGAPAAFDPLSNLSFLLNGGAGIDLTAGGALGILVQVVAADLAGQQLRLVLFGADATVAMEQTVVLPPVVPPVTFDALFPFAGFVQSGFAASTPNPNAVRAITLSITGPGGSDITLDLLGTYLVPEPATASMFGVGAIVVVTRLRRGNKRRTD
jgi:hypothetical protein